MYVTYLCISVILVLFGIVGAVYFVRFLKNVNLQNISIPALSESLNTFFIGIFYLYCAVVMAQSVVSPPPGYPEENDIAIIEENEDPVTEFYNEHESDNLMTTETMMSSTFPNQDFLLNYQAFFKNMMVQNGHKKNKELASTSIVVQSNVTYMSEEECFEHMFMEYSMFLYSFLHSALSLVVSTVKASPPKSKRAKQIEESKPETSVHKLKLTTIILVLFLIPMICVLALYFLLQYDMQVKLFSQKKDPTWDILYNPINVTTPGKSHEINSIVHNIYSIVNSSRSGIPPMKHATYSNRKPKQLEECPKFTMMIRTYTLLVFLLYFLATFYSKMKEMEMKTSNAKAAKQLNISVITFGLLWVFSIVDMFLKTYIIDSKSNILTDIFLSLGNLNHLSIILMNYLAAKETIKKYNLVGPQA